MRNAELEATAGTLAVVTVTSLSRYEKMAKAAGWRGAPVTRLHPVRTVAAEGTSSAVEPRGASAYGSVSCVGVPLSSRRITTDPEMASSNGFTRTTRVL